MIGGGVDRHPVDGLPRCGRVDMEILGSKFVEGCIMSGY